ncbi:hypothetical protein K1X76_10095 [bacterium]|nr:hypothetical protein [bacterium]
MKTNDSDQALQPLNETQEAKVKAFYKKMQEKAPPKISLADGLDISPPPEVVAEISAALGTTDAGLMSLFLNQVKVTFPDRGKHEQNSNNALAILHSLKPQSELETLLCTQMIGTHNLAMTFFQRALIDGQYPDMVDANVNRATKLLRTFTTQMETLNKLRGKSQQKVTVEHVHVYEGGQAVVGNIAQDKGRV